MKTAMITADENGIPQETLAAIRNAGIEITCRKCLTEAELIEFAADADVLWMFGPNLALTAGRPFIQQGGEVIKTTEMLALNIVNSFYASARSRGVGQAKAVIFFVLVAVLSILQLHSTREKEVQQ